MRMVRMDTRGNITVLAEQSDQKKKKLMRKTLNATMIPQAELALASRAQVTNMKLQLSIALIVMLEHHV